jgi:hypothetical protein
MQKMFKGLRVLDWTLALGLVVWGVATASLWTSLAGVLSLGLVLLNPAARIKRWLERKLLAKRAPHSGAGTVVVAEAMQELARSRTAEMPETRDAAAPDFSRNGFAAYPAAVLSASPHNRLTPAGQRLRAQVQPFV